MSFSCRSDRIDGGMKGEREQKEKLFTIISYGKIMTMFLSYV
jgi:hypothetical protein